MKTLKTLLRILVMILAGVVLGVNVFMWNARTLTGNVLPMPFGIGASVVLTGSMEPTISPDDLIIVVDRDSYGEDDIVVFQSGRVLVVHRILSIEGDTVVTRGDANDAADAPIRITDIKGAVVAVIPAVGTAVKLLKTPTATILLLVAAVALMEVSYRKEKQQGSDELEKIKEEIRKLKEEQEV